VDIGTMNAQAYWDGKFMFLPGASFTYNITPRDYVDPANVTADIYGPSAFFDKYPAANPVSAVFVMVQVGPDWFIRQISLNGTLTVQ
jgi:hypothetical protein